MIMGDNEKNTLLDHEFDMMHSKASFRRSHPFHLIKNVWQLARIRLTTPLRFALRPIAALAMIIALFATITTIVPLTNQKNSTQLLTLPLTGAFARFPLMSALTPRQKRMTGITVWNDDSDRSYFRHFLYTAQLNADVLDILIVNRRRKNDSHCLDFDKLGIDITWGGNIKHVCMDDSEWRTRYVDFFCAPDLGWDCTEVEYEAVKKEFWSRNDGWNFDWRPLYGYVFRDLLPDPQSAYWAWIDMDMFVGNFRHYPFNILSGLSYLTGMASIRGSLYMAGQLTAFNYDDKALDVAWKMFTGMESAERFTNYTEETRFPDSPEEVYWSTGYIRSDDNLPGSTLSYALYPDLNGDDIYDYVWDNPWQHGNKHMTNLPQVYLVSGREVLLASTSYNRAEAEELILHARSAAVDELGGLGWTGGEDGSAYIVDDPAINTAEARSKAIDKARKAGSLSAAHTGLVKDIKIEIWPGREPQGVEPDPLAVGAPGKPPIMRQSLIHLKEQQPNHMLVRLERDDRARGYERKLFRHFLWSKGQDWFELPPFEITEGMILRHNAEFMEVFKIGESRETTLWYRNANGTNSVG